MSGGRPKGPDKVRLASRVLPATRDRLTTYAAEAGIPINAALDEWSSLAQEREDLVDELRRVQDETRATQQGYLDAMRNLKRALDRQSAEVQRLRARGRGARRIPPGLEEKLRVRTLEDLARRLPCTGCGGALLVSDLDLGHVTCAPCRRDRVAALITLREPHEEREVSACV